MNKKIIIAVNIGRLLAQQGILPSQLARNLKFSRSYVSYLLAGKVMPSAERLHKIAQTLGVTSDSLFVKSTSRRSG